MRGVACKDPVLGAPVVITLKAALIPRRPKSLSMRASLSEDRDHVLPPLGPEDARFIGSELAREIAVRRQTPGLNLLGTLIIE